MKDWTWSEGEGEEVTDFEAEVLWKIEYMLRV